MKVKLEPYALQCLAEEYDEINRSDTFEDFKKGILYGIRLTLVCLFGWTISYDNDSVIRIRNKKGKVIYEEV